MKVFFTVFFLALCALNSFAQTWMKQPSGVTTQLRHVFFVNENTGWVVGAGGTVLKTTDGGSTWSGQNVQGPDLLIGCYFVSPTIGWVGGDHGVYKTTDGGTTWQNQPGPDGITKLHFVNENLGWAVGGVDGSEPRYGDIYKTTNGGAEWTKQTNSGTWVRFYGVQFVDANTGWAYTEYNGLLIKTTDGGQVWTPQMQYGSSVKIRGMYFLDKDNGWATGRTETSGAVYKTVNGGAQWTDFNAGLMYQVSSPHFITSNLGWAIGSGRSDHGVLKTTDGGASWTIAPISNDALNQLFMLNENHGWAVGENGAIYSYTSSTNVNNSETEIYNFSLDQNYPNPFNPTTTINYSVSSDGFISMKVYSILGTEVAALVEQNQKAGTYSVDFNASELPSGIYLYQLNNGRNTITKKFMLLK